MALWFKNKEKKTPPQEMSRSHAESLKRFYALSNDRQLAALYKNRYGMDIRINEKAKQIIEETTK